MKIRINVTEHVIMDDLSLIVLEKDSWFVSVGDCSFPCVVKAIALVTEFTIDTFPILDELTSFTASDLREIFDDLPASGQYLLDICFGEDDSIEIGDDYEPYNG